MPCHNVNGLTFLIRCRSSLICIAMCFVCVCLRGNVLQSVQVAGSVGLVLRLASAPTTAPATPLMDPANASRVGQEVIAHRVCPHSFILNSLTFMHFLPSRCLFHTHSFPFSHLLSYARAIFLSLQINKNCPQLKMMQNT